MRPRLALIFALAALLFALPAHANMAKAIFEGERWALLAPENKTRVGVDAERLEFSVAGDLATATVLASYQMSNGADAAEAVDIAFAYVRGEREGDMSPRAAVQADGADVPFRAVNDADLLAPKLKAWLAAHPEIDRKLAAVIERGEAVGGDRALAAPVQAAGGRCDDDCRHLVIWYRSTKTAPDEEAPPSKHGDDDRTYEAAREAIPGEVEALSKAFSTGGGMSRLGFLLFHVDFAPRQRRAITVRYEQRATLDRAANVNDTYRFEYLLSPASRWASFGPLEVSVRVPEKTRFTSPLPFRSEGGAGAMRASFPTLPGGELRFEVTSLRGLWFGWYTSDGYWAVLIAAAALAAIGVGAATGTLWEHRRALVQALLRIFVAGPLAAAVVMAIAVLLLSAYPHHALGFGYGGVFGAALAVLAAWPLGAIASFIAAAVRSAREQDDEAPDGSDA